MRHAGLSVCAEERRHDPAATVVSLFRDACASDPSAVAVIAGERALTYSVVTRAAIGIADQLRELGVQPGDRVGVRCGRHALMPSALLGVLDAGGAFVPIEPDAPHAWAIGRMKSAGCRVVIGRSRDALGGFTPLDLDDHGSNASDMPSGSPRLAGCPSPDAPASVMFTSGSTGRPKGAVIPHRAIVRLCHRPGFLRLDRTTRFLHISPLAFDASTLEIWGPLLNGGSIVLAPAQPGLRDIEALIREHGINTAWLTAALFHLCVDEHPAVFDRLTTVLTGGDVVSPKHAARLRARRSSLRIVNGYGPTENTTFTTTYDITSDIDPAVPIPIGTPVSGTGVCIVGPDLRPLPRGIPGELVATGDGLALGYIGDDTETDTRFVTVPGVNARGYRTGDRAVMRDDGLIEFLGRIDDQFKIRGYRIEPAEIEQAIRNESGVRDAAVVCTGHGNHRTLHAAVTLADDAQWPDLRRTLAENLARRLPAHLVPSTYSRYRSIPIGPTGKTDRALVRTRIEEGWDVGDAIVPRDSGAVARDLAAAGSILAAAWHPFDPDPVATLACEPCCVQIERPGTDETPQAFLNRVGSALGVSALNCSGVRVTLTDPEGHPCEIRWDGQLRLRLSPETSEHIAGWRTEHLRRVLGSLQAVTQDPVGSLDIVGDEERHEIEHVWNDTEWEHGVDVSLIDLIDRVTSEHPDRPALADERSSLTYRQLQRRFHAVAEQLRGASIEPGDRVALMDTRGVESVIGVLGILRAGAVCVPLNPETPSSRRDAMLDAAGAKLLLWPCVETAEQPLDTAGSTRLLIQTADERDGLRFDAPPLESTAYVLFTSGSSGLPKAVPIRHGSLLNRILWMTERFGIAPADTVAQKNRLAWDVSMWEYLWPLASGAKTFVLDADTASDPKRLVAACQSHGISVWHIIPSLLLPLARAFRGVERSPVRLTICSGEALSPIAAAEYLSNATGSLFNLYGPTEAAIDVTCWECRPNADLVPIGTPIANTRVRIIDQTGRPCPVGAIGELELEGIQVSSGYLNAASSAFSTVPGRNDSDQAVYRYRTGDLGWWREDGAIGFLGRKDSQVQLLGFRIEVTEIESALLLMQSISDAAVCMVGHGVDAHIVAVCVAAVDRNRAELETLIRGELRSSLETHMVPTRFVWTNAIPRLANSKIDRRAVAAMAEDKPSSSAGETIRSSDPIEVVRRVWARTLGHPPVSDSAEFVRAGGNSLALLRMLLEIESSLNIELPVMPALADPSPRSIAEVFEQAMLQDHGEAFHGAALRRNTSGHLHKLSDGPRVVVMLPHLGGAIGFLGDSAQACSGRVALYAIQPAGLLNGESPLNSVEEMIQGYADLIETQGWPLVTVAGFSSGAPLAMELAIELGTRSIGVADLIVVDGIPVHRPPPPEWLIRPYGKFRRLIPPGRMPLWVPGSHHRNLSGWEPLQQALGTATLRALYQHTPSRYEGRSVVVCRRRTDSGLGLASWKRVLRGPTREVLIDSDSHMGLWRRPHCDAIVDAFMGQSDSQV